MKIYLITDTHFFHSKMLEYENRPPDFNEKIIKGLAQIPMGAMLIHLGDLCIGRDKEALEIFRRATPQVHTILVKAKMKYKNS